MVKHGEAVLLLQYISGKLWQIQVSVKRVPPGLSSLKLTRRGEAVLVSYLLSCAEITVLQDVPETA